MNKLIKYNNKVLKKYKLIKNSSELSAPLLVSSNNEFFESLDNNKILYIGQETNCWVNYHGNNFNYNDLSETYNNFIKKGANNKLFWSFIKDLIESQELKNIVWANTLIAGKRQQKGTPTTTDELIDISANYLIFLYKYFNPTYTIIVNGPNNPYYNVTKKFLTHIGSNINDWPTNEKPLIIDNDKKIIWTYHPNYLNRSHKINDIENEIKKLIKIK